MKAEYYYPLLSFLMTFFTLLMGAWTINLFVGLRAHLRQRREMRAMCSRHPVYFARLHRWWLSRRHRKLFPHYRCNRPKGELATWTDDCVQQWCRARFEEFKKDYKRVAGRLDGDMRWRRDEDDGGRNDED
jgi:hypothetical protein